MTNKPQVPILLSESEIADKLARAKASYDAYVAASAVRIIRYRVQAARLTLRETVDLYRVTNVFHPAEVDVEREEPLCRRASFSDPL
jgi:hypothetical protein